MRLRPLAAGLTLAALAVTVPDTARASYIVTFSQIGGNVIASGSGTIDTNGLSLSSSTGTRSAFVNPNFGVELTGMSEVTNLYNGSIGSSGAFGSGSITNASTGTGDLVGLSVSSNAVVVPSAYVSGAPLIDTATYTGQTFASLGLTPGSYVYSFGSGVNADTITVNIGGPASVPEPAALALLGTGLAGLFGLGLIRRAT